MGESHMTSRAVQRSWCNTFECVHVEPVDGGVELTSTIDGNDDSIFYTQAEWDQHVLEQMSGRWLHTLSPETRELVQALLPVLDAAGA